MPWIEGSRAAGFRIRDWNAGRGSKKVTISSHDTKPEAVGALALLKEEALKDKLLRRRATSTTPLEVLLERWKRSRLADGKAEAAYLDKAMGLIKSIAAALEWKMLADITADSLDIYKAEKRTGWKEPVRVLKAFLQWCRRTLRVRVDDFIFLVETTSGKAHRELLALEQVANVMAEGLKAGGFNVQTCIEHLYLYPCRPIDVSRCDVRDWNSAKREITYRKTKNRRPQVHLVHEAHAVKLDQLAAGRDPAAPLFLDPWGRRWRIVGQSAQGLSSWYRQNIGEHILPPHQRGIYHLKDFGMTRNAEAAKGNMSTIQAMSGHLSKEAAERYIATNRDKQRELIAAVPVLEPQSAAAKPTRIRRRRGARLGAPLGHAAKLPAGACESVQDLAESLQEVAAK